MMLAQRLLNWLMLPLRAAFSTPAALQQQFSAAAMTERLMPPYLTAMAAASSCPKMQRLMIL